MNIICLWTNVLLESFNNLVNFADAVDKKIDILSHNMYCSQMTTLEVSNKIIDLMQKKISICNTKVLIEKVIKSLDKDSQKILILKYLDKFSIEKIAENFDYTLRTIYRKLIKAKEKFAKSLLFLGFDNEKLTQMYKGHLWLYNAFLKEKENLQNLDYSKFSSMQEAFNENQMSNVL